MIYKFSDFEKSNENYFLKLENSEKLYEQSDTFQEYLKHVTEDYLKDRLEQKLKTLIKDNNVIYMLVRNSQSTGLLKSCIDIFNGRYTKALGYFNNIVIYTFATMAASVAIKKGFSKLKKFITAKSLFSKIKPATTQSIDDIKRLESLKKYEEYVNTNKIYTLETDIVTAEGKIFNKGKQGMLKTIEELDPATNKLKNVFKFFPKSGNKISSTGYTIHELENISIKSLSKGILDNSKIFLKQPIESTKNFFKLRSLWRNKYRIGLTVGIPGSVATGLAPQIYSNFSSVMDSFSSVINAFPAFNTGITSSEIQELKSALSNKDEFIKIANPEIYGTSEFQEDLNLTKEELSKITPDIFIGRSKSSSNKSPMDSFVEDLDKESDEIGYVVSWCLSSIMFEELKATVSDALNDSGLFSGEDYTSGGGEY